MITDELYEELKAEAITQLTIVASICKLYDETGNWSWGFNTTCVNFNNEVQAKEELEYLQNFVGFQYFLNDAEGKEAFKTNQDILDFIDVWGIHEIYKDVGLTSKRFTEPTI